jgi:hypothetical protein
MRAVWAAVLATVCAGCDNEALDDKDAFSAARSGALACIIPDASQKRCNTLSRFVFANDGSVESHNDVTMGGPPQVVMSSSILLTLKGDELCGSSAMPADVQKATFRIDGRPASEEEAASLRAELIGNLSSRSAQTYCLSFHPVGDGYELRTSIDGISRPEFTETVIWVRPDDGYRVGP